MKLKKLASLVLALALTVGLGTSAAFAAPTEDDATKGSITVTANAPGRTLAGYRLFNSTTDGTNYGYAMNPAYKDAMVTALQITDAAGKTDAAIGEEILNKLTASGFTAQNAKDFALAMQNALKSITQDTLLTEGTTTNGKTTYSASNVLLGYYLIVDNGDASATYAPTFAMLNPANKAVTVNAKDTVVVIDKTVKDTNETGFKNTGSVQIGDTITYQISGSIPAYVSTQNNQYKVKLTDALPTDGSLQYDSITSVVLAGNGITNPFTASQVKFLDKDNKETTDMTKATQFVFEQNVLDKDAATKIDYLKDAAATITITYTVKVTGAAKIVDEKTNTFHYEYGVPGSTFTPEDKKVTVYSYGFSVKKINEKSEVLAGAEFSLKDGDTELKFTKQADGSYALSATGTDTLTSGTDGMINIVGLDEGTYSLTETKAPHGYNLLASPVSVIITASADKTDCTVTADGTELSNKIATVTDTTGLVLPGTGGAGTQLFTVAGILILACAGAFLFFSRKRVFSK